MFSLDSFDACVAAPTRVKLFESKPPGTTPILPFIARAFPTQITHDIGLSVVDSMFFVEPAFISTATLMTTVIPLVNLVRCLLDQCRRRWSDDYRSIEWQTRLFPLWTLDWWLLMIPVVESSSRVDGGL